MCLNRGLPSTRLPHLKKRINMWLPGSIPERMLVEVLHVMGALRVQGCALGFFFSRGGGTMHFPPQKPENQLETYPLGGANFLKKRCSASCPSQSRDRLAVTQPQRMRHQCGPLNKNMHWGAAPTRVVEEGVGDLLHREIGVREVVLFVDVEQRRAHDDIQGVGVGGLILGVRAVEVSGAGQPRGDFLKTFLAKCPKKRPF